MKKITLIVISVLLFGFFVSCNNNKNKSQQEENTMRSGFIKIAVDQTMQPTMQAEVDMFETENAATIEALYVSESEAIDLLMKDSVRLAVTARRFTEAELGYFHLKTFEPEEIRIAIDGVALIIHPENPDSIISVKDVRRILTGEVTRWDEIFPNSKLGKIQVVFDNTNSSIVRYANDSICREKPLSSDLNALEKNEEVVNYISENKSAMGLIGVNLISDTYGSSAMDFTKKIQVMRVSRNDNATRANAVQPYQYYIYNHQYPFIREIFILLNDPRGELPKGFTRFVTSDVGQRIILRSGLLPSTMPINAVKIVE
ncbi:MAG: substrate-binding domain-containing protein [Dysgonamonadaceae bacterium]|jgi:phosphate transport system substrate-binding protein|nr:substrate-binding domain-containing protein [Dysgonamonadaceae bacterium]MDD3308748.1 substrate-binding domain-containing protein [Dysgonamonadaceae bacterium]MDD3900943.1 substrate-binding domain-containing protein [Dysgonamonadaceae bacterium]MDD4398323.1 substrate-binding domain-containing protein [Dysgonamonadaceae bacterium]MEA5080803.1 substrate-binding domain-containing protein [Dysgonamonadaceae bacterium]